MEITCPHCGFARDVPDEKIPPKAQLATCPKCSHKFKFREDEEAFELREEVSSTEEQEPEWDQGDEAEDIWSKLESLQGPEEGPGQDREEPFRSQVPQSEVPWENLQEFGFFPGLWQTIKQVMLAPVGFFESLTLGQGYSKPLIFYLLVAEVQALAQFFWRLAGIIPRMEGQAEGLLGLGLAGFGSVLLLVLYPVILAVMLFVVSGLNHLCLLAVRDGARGFEGTFKVVSYSSAPMVLAVIPVFGPMAGMMWTLVCTFLGFKLVHQTSGGKVIMAMVLPLVAIFFLSSLIVMFKGAGLG